MVYVYEEKIEELALSYERNVKWLTNKTRLICSVPHIAPEAYLHVLYSGIPPVKVIEMEENLGIELPEYLKIFFGKYNGLSLFSDSLSLFGLRSSFVRCGEQATQPYSILEPNKEERPHWFTDKQIIFGFYNWDGTILYCSKASSTIFRSETEDPRVLNSWPNFDGFMISEIKRLSKLFDKMGMQRDEDSPTTP